MAVKEPTSVWRAETVSRAPAIDPETGEIVPCRECAELKEELEMAERDLRAKRARSGAWRARSRACTAPTPRAPRRRRSSTITGRASASTSWS